MTERIDMRALVTDVMPRAYVAAFRILGHRDEAREACQEAAGRALASRAHYDRSRPFYPWFHRIVKNCCLDRIRGMNQARARTQTLRAEPPSAAPGPEAVLLGTERARAVSRAVEALPAALREIIELRHFQDASYAEIGAILGLAPGTVMSRLFRARKALRDRLADDPAFSRPEAPAGGAA